MPEDKKQDKPFKSIFRKVSVWKNLWFYQKSQALYQMTYVFCHRFLPQYGDRTSDQMVQAARSGKQNIVEGSEDGKTSTKMEIELLNVARASIGELRQDYEDFIKSRQLRQWTSDDERFQQMQAFTKSHNQTEDYEPYFMKWTAEEMANVALTLCHQIDAMMNKYLKNLEASFVKHGGIKERMHQARTDYRQEQDKRLAELEQTLPQLQQQLKQAKAEAKLWKEKHENLKQRALKAYRRKEEETESLKKKLNKKENT